LFMQRKLNFNMYGFLFRKWMSNELKAKVRKGPILSTSRCTSGICPFSHLLYCK
jgi:hypothetical protein